MKQKQTLTSIQKELASVLRERLNDDEAYLGTMLALIVNQTSPDENCRMLLDFIRENPQAGYDEILLKSDDIIGIEDPFADDD